MKKLSEIYKELGIAFTFPITIRDTHGNETYYEDSYGYWRKNEYNDNGKETYYKDSKGFWCKNEYNDNGNRTCYEDSYGFWGKYEYNDNGKETYYKDSEGRVGTSRSQSCEGKVVEIDGKKYELKEL